MRDLSGARILIVDDQEANVRILERALSEAGFMETTCTTDPLQAVPLFRELDPDLVLLDLHMPGLDGFEVMRELQPLIGEGSYVPILVLTADPSTDIKRKALAEGAKDFLTKPFDLTEVLLRIRNLLETRFLHVEVQRHNEVLEEDVQTRTKELRESLQALRTLDDERRTLLDHLVNAQEEERERIAGDIHDDSVQVMTAVGMRLGLLRKTLGDEEQVQALAQLEQVVRLALSRLRNLLFDLHPPILDSEGLAPALRLSLERLNGEIEIDYAVTDGMDIEPSPEIRVILYRIAQEAIANARKHARATRLNVELEVEGDGYLVRVHDDGRGFSPEELPPARPGHLGFTAMRERAEMAGGWWRVNSRPGKGTSVEFWIPEPRRENVAS